MNEPEALQYLESLQFFRIKLGLETTRELLDQMGNPQQGLAIFHIAGTNGKGSVGATLHTALSCAGYRCAFYSSPHLSCVRERFRLGNRYISAQEFATLMSELRRLFEQRRIQPTYFECTTLLALRWFSEQGAEAVALETGLGGRLDATNVVRPLVSIITDISRDHEQYLGAGIEAIAAEKAGIIKPGVPVVFSGRAEAAIPVIEAQCERLAAPLYLLGRDFSAQARGAKHFDYLSLHGEILQDLPLNLPGLHQVVNASLALAALELLAQRFTVSAQVLRRALAQVQWPGRMEYVSVSHGAETRLVLLEGAHNEAGVQALLQSLATAPQRRRLLLVWGQMADKQMELVWRQLLAQASCIILTQAQGSRSAAASALFAALSVQEQARARCAETVSEALRLAFELSVPDDLICVAGSLHVVGEARQLLKGGLVEET